MSWALFKCSGTSHHLTAGAQGGLLVGEALVARALPLLLLALASHPQPDLLIVVVFIITIFIVNNNNSNNNNNNNNISSSSITAFITNKANSKKFDLQSRQSHQYHWQ